MKAEEYKQYEVLRCNAATRPDYCQYPGNVCCFSCDKNKECMAIAIENHQIKPCSSEMPVHFKDKVKLVSLFDKDEICEFSI